MKAALLVDGAAGLEVSDVACDLPIGREVLVRMTAVGLCHSDYHVIDGTLDRPRPLVLGHEGAGVVEAIGPDTRSVAVGDHVVTCLVMGCGDCVACRRGEDVRCTRPSATRRAAGEPPRLALDGAAVNQMAGIGALAEYTLVDERALVRVPPSMPTTLAPLLGCAVVTGLGSVFNVARVTPGETVAVVGCGGVGLNVIQGARIAGASRIVAVDVNASKLDVARRLGATDVVDSSQVDAIAHVRDLTGEGVDHAFEVVGSSVTVRQAFELAAPGRAAYALGIQSDRGEVTIAASALRRSRRLIGVFMGDTVPSRDIPRYIELWQDGKLDLETMVSHVLPFERVNDGFDLLAQGEATRTVVTF